MSWAARRQPNSNTPMTGQPRPSWPRRISRLMAPRDGAVVALRAVSLCHGPGQALWGGLAVREGAGERWEMPRGAGGARWVRLKLVLPKRSVCQAQGRVQGIPCQRSGGRDVTQRPDDVTAQRGAIWRHIGAGGRVAALRHRRQGRAGAQGGEGAGDGSGRLGSGAAAGPSQTGGHSRGTGRFCPAQPSNISPFPSPRKYFPVFIARRVPNEMSVPQLPHPALPQEPLDSDAFPPKQYPKPAEKCMFSLSCKGLNAKLTPSRLQLRSAVR